MKTVRVFRKLEKIRRRKTQFAPGIHFFKVIKHRIGYLFKTTQSADSSERNDTIENISELKYIERSKHLRQKAVKGWYAEPVISLDLKGFYLIVSVLIG